MSIKEPGIVFDATNSWNGYNHQGKIALWYALGEIIKLIDPLLPQSLNRQNLEKYFLEIEYMEDFSVGEKVGESLQYHSVHQVKDREDTSVDAYESALLGLVKHMSCKLFLEILDAYDHKTLTRPEGTYYDGNETIEEVAVNMLYDMIKNPVWYDCNKQMAAIKFLLFLEWNNALFIDGEKRISETLLVALILMIEKSRDEDKEMIIRTVLNCIC